MKKFIVRIALLFLIVFAADYLIGNCLGYVARHIIVGGQGRDNYIADVAKEDILVFGSSRAAHHYNSMMLEDSLGLSAYNCGDDGSGIILSYARLAMIKERHNPQFVIHDVCDDFDFLKGDNHKYLGKLRPHYDKEIIRPIFFSIDVTEKYKMMSHLYRYNSVFFQNVFTYLTGRANDGGEKGFRPICAELDKMKIKIESEEELNNDCDSLKLDYIQRFIDSARESKLYFVVSPIWYGMNTERLKPVMDICEANGVPFVDFSNDPKYVRHDEYFSDGMHLNARGADEFTRDLIRILHN